MAKKQTPEIRQAIELIKKMSMDEKEWQLYQSREMAIMDYNVGMRKSKEEGLAEGRQEGRAEGKQEGIQQGIQEGERKKQIEIAKEMLKLGMAIKDIEKVTKLSKEEIEKYRKEQESS